MPYLPRITIFFGSFLSFFVQPMVGRTLLPIFGGSSTVWVTCLAAFQLLTLVGYGYAFVPSKGRGGRRIFHFALIVVAAAVAATVPAIRPALLTTLAGLSPALGIIIAVLSLAGIVSVVLSANATVVQSWTPGGREVYHLYAVSNIGSFAGLLAYPLLAEPFVALNAQWVVFGAAILVYGALLAWTGKGRCAVEPRNDSAEVRGVCPRQKDAQIKRASGTWLWFVLPGISCALMTAATAYLTSDIVALPLVWAVLLAAFLLSYVIGFSSFGTRGLPVWMCATIVTLGFAAAALRLKGSNGETYFLANVVAVLALLSVLCTALHAWLFSIRPDKAQLPFFYFAISLGGCAGGMLAGLVPPLVFDTTAEYPIVLALACTALLVWFLTETGRQTLVIPKKARMAAAGLLVVIGVTVATRHIELVGEGEILCRGRDFYGVVSVEKMTHSEYEVGKFCDYHVFRHGRTAHGAQLRAPEVRRKPTAYFSLNGGGIPFATKRQSRSGHTEATTNGLVAVKRPLRVAVVGMGMGTLAAYGEAGDYFRLYEISPTVIGMATNATLFSFLADCPAKIDIVEGDARLALQKDVADGIEKFDIVFLDVYSGDSVPGHLVTREAFSLFKSILKDDGILACHISNWHIDLYSVMKAAARHLGMNLLETLSGSVRNEYAEETAWAFMTNGAFDPIMPNCCRRVDLDAVRDIPLMTDDRGSLIFNINFGYYPPLRD